MSKSILSKNKNKEIGLIKKTEVKIKIVLLKIFYKLKKIGLKTIIIEVVVYSLLTFIIFTAFVNTYYANKLETQIYNAFEIEKLPQYDYAIVFGAGLKTDKSASEVLSERVQVGLNLLLSGKVKRILLSGDNRFADYNEPKAMLEYIEKKIGTERFTQLKNSGQINQDFGGRSTYDTCYRAKNTFGINNAIVVTQEFHIVRTLTTCRLLGIDSIGIKSDLKEFNATFWWKFRDILAFDKAWLDLKIFKPKAEVL